MSNHQKAFHDMEHNFFSLISDTYIDYGTSVAYTTGVYAAGLNPAIVNRIDSTFIANLTTCKKFYSDKKIPWGLIVPDHLYNSAIEKLVQDKGFKFTGEGVAMVLLMDKITSPLSSSSLVFREIKGDLSLWSIPLDQAFGATPETPDLYARRHELATKKNANLYHLSGFIEDTIICSLSLSVQANYARIDDVATMPEYQNKGYATQLIYTALKKASQLKVTECFLEASSDGLSLYKKIGFQELFVNRYYELLLGQY